MAKTKEALNQPIFDLVQARRRTAKSLANVDQLDDELKTTLRAYFPDLMNDLEEARQMLKEAKSQEDEADQALRAEALEYFEETGDKKPAEGLEIREYTGVEYDDDEAYDRGEQLGVLTLDHKRLQKMAKSAILDGEIVSPLFDFCTVTTEPKVFVSDSLSIDMKLPKAA